MIYTVTLNPAMDYNLTVHSLNRGVTGLASSAVMTPGGKGVNVSLMLHRLGLGTVPMGICAGVTGTYLLDGLRAAGLSPDFVHASPQGGPEVWTRINVKIAVVGDGEREVNVPGPTLPEGSFDTLLDKIEKRLARNDTLILSGSVPPGTGDDAYARILDRVAGRNIRVIADTTGPRLRAILPYHPYLIKPNRAELEELAGATLTDDKAIVKAARDLQQQGAGHVLVSLGGEGCLLVPSFDPAHSQADRGDGHLQGACLRMGAIAGTVHSTVGAGDAMIAGLLCGLEKGWNADNILRLATASAATVAFAEEGVAVTGQDVDQLYALSAVSGKTPCLHLPY